MFAKKSFFSVCPFKRKQRPAKFSNLTTLYSPVCVESNSVVRYTPQSLTPLYSAVCVESDSVVQCTLQSLTPLYSAVCLESDSTVWCTPQSLTPLYSAVCVESNSAVRCTHSWAQRKLSLFSPLNPLNILLSNNSPLLSFGFNGLND